MADFIFLNGVLSVSPYNIGKLLVTENAVIRAREFEECDYLTEVVIPDKVENAEYETKVIHGCTYYFVSSYGSYIITEIEERAFAYCKNLRSATLPDTLKKIGKGAFKNCENLETVVIPEGVEIIDDDAFRNCIRLKKVVIPSSVRVIGENAFRNCKGLQSVIISEQPADTENTVPFLNLKSGAFFHCIMLSSVTLPKHLKTIGTLTFGNCRRLKSIVIPNGVKSIGDEIFDKCLRLKEVTMMSTENADSKIFLNGYSLDFITVMMSVIYQNKKDKKISTYNVIKLLIDKNDIELIRYLIDEKKFFNKENIDKIINYAIEKKKNEIYIFLTRYKSENIGFEISESQFAF